MARNVIVDAGFLVALVSDRDTHHTWAVSQAPKLAPPWLICESAISEAIHLVGRRGRPAIDILLRRHALVIEFSLSENLESVLKLLEKYSDVPMSLADACLVRMTEILGNPTLLTTDEDFRIYRRNGRQIIPCAAPF
jgi:predicted nucleic acid-binding protein